jgi:Lon protease-like protein
MTIGSFAPSFDTFPATLPIFPLPGALLLPGGKLPLQIFEPRYLAMTRDALASDRLIGIIQPLRQDSETEGLVSHTAALYPIGCAGRITAYSETDDGRYLITLTGVCRFAIQKELPTVGGYRRVVPDFERFRTDMDAAATANVDRQRLLKALQAYFAHQKISIDPGAVVDIPDDKLVTSLAMVCPFEAKEKQALLEAADLAERSRVMTALLELGAFAGQDDGPRH